MPRVLISVIGGADCSAAEAAVAEQVGAEIARAGAVLVTGGLSGVMEAVSRGAHKAGGLVVGILPGGSARDANRYVDVPVVTGLGDARNVIVAGSGAGVIAIGGSLGTLTEIAFALKRGIPVVGLGTWELDRVRAGGAEIIRADTPKQAVEIILKR
ncbi:MAG: TIGR00725 family protein [Planctomycetota bacterium]|nr:TIGR00725 family protein [Planctomycetota bacterium]